MCLGLRGGGASPLGYTNFKCRSCLCVGDVLGVTEKVGHLLIKELCSI
jgi:hypothetical protein